MSIWSRLFGRKGVSLTELPAFMLTPEAKSGVVVSVTTALQVVTVLACAKVLAEGVAQVPLKLHKERPGGGSDVASDHPLYDVLYRRPNGWQTSFEFRETVMLHLALCGNAYVFKNLVGDRVHELIPLEPGKVVVTRNADLSLSYAVTGEDGLRRPIPTGQMWHLRGASWNGWGGLETVKLAREAIGLALALEESHALLHKNGAQTAGVYSVDGVLTADQHTQLTAWIKKHAAAANRFNPLILDNGAKWLQQQMTGVDAQHLETRRFQIEDVCRAFRVMPIMVGQSDKAATYASAEQMFLAHVIHTLGPWFERLEQSIDVNLLSGRDDRRVYAKFNVNALMRGASKDRAEYFAKALGAGGAPAWMTQDEVRGLEELNPLGGAAGQLREPTNVAAAPRPTGKED